MPVSIRFERDNHIVIWVFEGAWIWEEYYDRRHEANAVIELCDHPVDMIVDMTRSRFLPQNAMSHAGKSVQMAPSNLRKTIFVGSNQFFRIFFRMFTQLYGALRQGEEMSYVMVATIDEAYAIIDALNIRDS